jgi:hypothetical protein
MEQNINEVEQTQVAETSSEATPNLETTSQDKSEQELDLSQPVTSLDEAKKVLNAQKSQRDKVQASKKQPSTSSQSEKIDYEKQYKEQEKLISAHTKELGELRKFYKENSPAIESYKQLLAQQQEQELLNKYQSDPASVIKELARREAQQQIAPYQEQMAAAQASNINSTIKEQLGSDYDTYAPVMGEMMEQFLEMDAANGTKYARELADNPHVLMQLAAGKVALSNKVQSQQQQQVAQQKKAQNLRVASGVGKGNSVVSSPSTDNFASLSTDEMRAQMKAMGIIK